MFSPKVRPLVLIFDGLNSHIILELIKCAEENIYFSVFDSTLSFHILQPLDVSLFDMLKASWKRFACTMTHLTGRVVNQFNITRLFRIAWDTTVNLGLHSEGFKRTCLVFFQCDNATIPIFGVNVKV